MASETRTCACGCGAPLATRRNPTTGEPVLFAPGHHMRLPKAVREEVARVVRDRVRAEGVAARLTRELEEAREVLDEAASVLEEQRDEWTLERQPWKRMSDDDVLANMQGSATLDDPPDGWTRRDLAMYSRGYLTAEERQLGNAASTVASVARIIRRVLAATPPDTEGD